MNRRTTTEAYDRGSIPTGKIELTRYVVGIDLGTTNTALAYVDRRSGRKAREVRPFPISQLTDPGITQEQPTLPSAVYLRGGHELSPEQVTLPWTPKDDPLKAVVGTLARRRGILTPNRLITSAKSWLCHPGVDRRAAILPWGAPDNIGRRSPVEVEALILGHLRAAWDHVVAEGEPGKSLVNQDLVVTIPASFDEVARELTVEAIQRAGLEALLIEEPQAALYAWIAANEETWRDELEVGQTILVCDVGGGTTDFSLIVVTDEDGEPGFERTAVGDHLLLGGDNMDLALARQVEVRLKSKLDLQAWNALVQECRDAKERLLGGEAEEVQVAVQRRGKKLIGGTLRATIAKAEAMQAILEGFFPLLEPDDAGPRGQSTGLKEFGLPFEADPAITRHLSGFLGRHGKAGKRIAVDHVLFNGGVFKTAVLRERVLDAIGRWQERPHELEGMDLDLAVSRGAAYYGLVRRGKGTRIKSGAGRAYYLEVGTSGQDRNALCLIPRGLEEGGVVTIGDHPLSLRANRPVVFPFHTSTVRDDTAGALVTLDKASFQELSPLHTVIRVGRRRGAKVKSIPVELVSRYTELGTLEMWAQATEEETRWRLELDTRPRTESRSAGEASAVTAGSEGVKGVDELPPADGGMVIAPERVERAKGQLREAFQLSAKEAQRPLEQLGKHLEESLESAREGWPVPVIRALFDELIEAQSTRSRSQFHESRWLNLAGWCLRPGFGSTLDPHRVKQLWKVQLEGMQNKKANAVRLEWVVAFRRVAGGLNRGQQEILFAPFEKYLMGHKRSASKQELAEYWRLAASLEHLSPKRKRRLGERLLDLIEQGKAPPRWGPWALGRLGGRVPLYGPLDRLVPADAAARWLDRLLAARAKGGEALFAYVQLARITGDRARDVPPDLRAKTIARLEELEAGPRTIRPLREVVQAEVRTQQEFYGDSVPIGLVLAH